MKTEDDLSRLFAVAIGEPPPMRLTADDVLDVRAPAVSTGMPRSVRWAPVLTGAAAAVLLTLPALSGALHRTAPGAGAVRLSDVPPLGGDTALAAAESACLTGPRKPSVRGGRGPLPPGTAVIEATRRSIRSVAPDRGVTYRNTGFEPRVDYTVRLDLTAPDGAGGLSITGTRYAGSAATLARAYRAATPVGCTAPTEIDYADGSVLLVTTRPIGSPAHAPDVRGLALLLRRDGVALELVTLPFAPSAVPPSGRATVTRDSLPLTAEQLRRVAEGLLTVR